ncbi:MAG: fibronectin type III domain-containing protein [Candidatus Competibacteraceae bacterium]|jgi:hypothetical protein|nr:fibronectin type III domain-containing protein [Candidatus Competibacteraceae bacterium]
MNYTLLLVVLAILFFDTADAGTWGQGGWSFMYWGDYPESAPVAPPENISIKPSSRELLISFDFDDSNGNDGWYVVDRYGVICENVNQPQDIVGAEGCCTTLEVSGLRPRQTYNCAVFASNAQGDGPKSVGVLKSTLVDISFLPALWDLLAD